ncbi:MAG: hypothetical protein KDD64_16875, partial [Bdellovibrionales bacterium]|nr:hypothetical protein [Bdellovibrionales bacterium]
PTNSFHQKLCGHGLPPLTAREDSEQLVCQKTGKRVFGTGTNLCPNRTFKGFSGVVERITH